MAEEKGTLQAMRGWVVDHKLRAVGTLWLTGIAGSIAYNWSRPGMKTSVKLIHARSVSSVWDSGGTACKLCISICVDCLLS